jgi:hypothetical protein
MLMRALLLVLDRLEGPVRVCPALRRAALFGMVILHLWASRLPACTCPSVVRQSSPIWVRQGVLLAVNMAVRGCGRRHLARHIFRSRDAYRNESLRRSVHGTHQPHSVLHPKRSSGAHSRDRSSTASRRTSHNSTPRRNADLQSNSGHLATSDRHQPDHFVAFGVGQSHGQRDIDDDVLQRAFDGDLV